MARVRRSDPGAPGWSLRRRGRGFELLDARGRKLTGEAAYERVRALALPPAWSEVWICPQPNGHIQATGLDAAGRRQYRYHDDWTASRSRAKFKRMGTFAAALPTLRAHVDDALDPTEPDLGSVLAGLVGLLDAGFFRVGSEAYAARHRTFGLTTLLREHATCRRDGTIVFDYTAKHGKRRVEQIAAPPLSELVGRLKRRRLHDDPRLFAARGERGWCAIRASELNAHLREVGGAEISAKDFRTFHATVLAAVSLAQTEVPTSKAARARAATAALRPVAEQLGNTLAVCRSSYVDPRLVDRWARGETIPVGRGELPLLPSAWSATERIELEAAVIELLELREA